MKRIYHVHRYLRTLANQQRGYSTPAEIDDALHLASRELFNHYNGATGEYQKGLPMARVGYGLTSVVNDALNGFLREMQYASSTEAGAEGVLQYGVLAVPANFVHPVSFRVPTATEEVRLLNKNQVTARIYSPINGPTAEAPFLEAVQGGYKVYPTDTPLLDLHYLSLPPVPKYAMVTDEDGELVLNTDGEPQYDDEASTDHGWPEQQENELLWIATKIISGEQRDVYMQQFADMQAQKGK